MINQEDRAALNALVVKGMHAAARCVERLIADGETVLTVGIIGPATRIEVLPPRRTSALRHDCGTYKITPADITYINVRFGCEIRWTLSRAEVELMRIADSVGQVH